MTTKKSTTKKRSIKKSASKQTKSKKRGALSGTLTAPILEHASVQFEPKDLKAVNKYIEANPDPAKPSADNQNIDLTTNIKYAANGALDKDELKKQLLDVVKTGKDAIDNIVSNLNTKCQSKQIKSVFDKIRENISNLFKGSI